MGFKLSFGSLLSLLLFVNASCATTPKVKTVNGTFAGQYLQHYEQDAFLGMPFALPPTGQRRFRRPHYINESFDGVRDATEYGPAV